MVVESVSAVVTSASTFTLTIPNPAGLVVGDLMVANLTAYAGDGTTGADTFNIMAGWTRERDDNPDNELVLGIHYKVADASDVAASNFTFTTNSASDSLTGQIIRVSGQNPVTPVGISSSYSNTVAESSTFAGTLSSYTPAVDGSLIVVNIAGVWGLGGSFRTTSGQTLTTGATMTEGFDTGGTDGSGGVVVSSAYGVQTTAAAITEYGATFSAIANDHYGQIVIFLPPVGATGTNTLVTTTSEAFTQSGTCDTNGTNILVEATGEVFTQSGRGESPTQWTNEAKTSTTWVNEDK